MKNNIIITTKTLMVTLLMVMITTPSMGQKYLIPKVPINNQLVVLKKEGYISCYNLSRNNPDWVAWKLTKQRTEKRWSRTNKFATDFDINKNHRVTSQDYTHSGYDRGHMCPAGDNTWDRRAMDDSFLMTNICPQNPTLNQKWWEHLESACRRWCQTRDIYIICGPIYNRHPRTIGQNLMIDVPTGFFKVILDLDNKRTIGFIYKNSDAMQQMGNVACSVDEVERITGYDFFWELPDEIERFIESTYNLQKWK